MTEETGSILVVEDNRMNRLKLALSLEAQGHRVSQAEDGPTGLALLKEQAFDVVLLDILMPEMDGYLVLERMKADVELRDIPVIVISALDEIDSVVRCIEMGAEDYLAKPFNPVLLRARLNTSLQRKKLRDLEKSYLQQEVMLRQNEKLATLGKLSAGMAHELNNPAAAARCSAAQLQSTFLHFQNTAFNLVENNFDLSQLPFMRQLMEFAEARASQTVQINPLERSDREDQLETWLEGQGVTDGWEIAPTLATMGLDAAAAADLVAGFNRVSVPATLQVLCDTFSVYNLIAELSQGVGKISEIVLALKSYAYLDQAPIQAVAIHQGLDDTLVILQSKVGQNIHIKRDYAANIPLIQAYGSELNQVWTNLLDNAFAAVDGDGEIVLRTRLEGPWVVVEIADNGHGIPPEIQGKVFDPFFTTRPVGQGAGLGLTTAHSIVDKHKGQIRLESRPGATVFEVRLPVNLPAKIEGYFSFN